MTVHPSSREDRDWNIITGTETKPSGFTYRGGGGLTGGEKGIIINSDEEENFEKRENGRLEVSGRKGWGASFSDKKKKERRGKVWVDLGGGRKAKQ